MPTFSLYVDDSGVRFPDKNGGQTTSPWFGLGGILLLESDEDATRHQFAAFRTAWREHLPEDIPLHSYDIRQGKGAYKWLRRHPDARSAFLGDITKLVTTAPVLCTACVIDRAGYAARYFEKYDETKRWWLCKTAFSVLLERTVKYVAPLGGAVRVYVERTDKHVDRAMRSYYDELRNTGMPFDGTSMAGYKPLDQSAFASTLYDFKKKDKTSPLMQLADLCLYPVCNAGYDKTGRDYQSLIDSRKLIDHALPLADVRTVGIKYSCFDSVVPKLPAGG